VRWAFFYYVKTARHLILLAASNRKCCLVKVCLEFPTTVSKCLCPFCRSCLKHETVKEIYFFRYNSSLLSIKSGCEWWL
jgi:hypothetical protein